MKKQLITALVSSMLFTTALPGMAEGGYLGAQFAQTKYEQSGTAANATADDGEGKPGALVLVGGYNVNDNVAIEGRFGFKAGDDAFDFATGGSTDIEVSHIFSVLGKFSTGEKVSPYFLIGFSDFELDASNGTTAEGDGLSFGAGIDFAVSDNAAIGLEYIQYADVDINGGGDAKLSAISLGINFKLQ